MKYAEERPGFDTSVHSWKPCTPERFARLVHAYTVTCCTEFGHAGLSMTSCKLDRRAVATIFYRPKHYPEHVGISTPCLMTVDSGDGRVITFERIPTDEYPGIPEIVGKA